MRALALAVAILALTGCPLRPRYAEFIGKESTQPMKLQVVEKKSGTPVAGATVEVGEAQRGKVSLRTDAEGFFLLPVDKRLLDDNALLVVSAPAGIGRTLVMGAQTVVAQPEAAPVDATEAADAGVSTY